jgi:hypothetical protein
MSCFRRSPSERIVSGFQGIQGRTYGTTVIVEKGWRPPTGRQLLRLRAKKGGDLSEVKVLIVVIDLSLTDDVEKFVTFQ